MTDSILNISKLQKKNEIIQNYVIYLLYKFNEDNIDNDIELS